MEAAGQVRGAANGEKATMRTNHWLPLLYVMVNVSTLFSSNAGHVIKLS